MALMRQCVLVRGNSSQVAWIPLEFASCGRVLDLRYKSEWSEGWRVRHVYKMPLSYDYVREHADDHKHQREASDV